MKRHFSTESEIIVEELNESSGIWARHVQIIELLVTDLMRSRTPGGTSCGEASVPAVTVPVRVWRRRPVPQPYSGPCKEGRVMRQRG